MSEATCFDNGFGTCGSQDVIAVIDRPDALVQTAGVRCPRFETAGVPRLCRPCEIGVDLGSPRKNISASNARLTEPWHATNHPWHPAAFGGSGSSYRAITGESLVSADVIIPSQSAPPTDMVQGFINDYVKQHIDNGKFLVIGTSNDSGGSPLIGNHAYLVIGYNSGGQVRLFNPHNRSRRFDNKADQDENPIKVISQYVTLDARIDVAQEQKSEAKAALLHINQVLYP